MNQMNSLRFAFNNWNNKAREMSIIGKIDDEKKKNIIALFAKFMKGNRHALLRDILKKFHFNARVGDAIRNVHAHLHRTL